MDNSEQPEVFPDRHQSGPPHRILLPGPVANMVSNKLDYGTPPVYHEKDYTLPFYNLTDGKTETGKRLSKGVKLVDFKILNERSRSHEKPGPVSSAFQQLPIEQRIAWV